MSIDIAKDLLKLGEITIHISTVIIWVSGLIGLYLNYKKLQEAASKSDEATKLTFLQSLAEDNYHLIEKLAKMTPTKVDDKLVSFLKISIRVFEATYGEKPTTSHVRYLISRAAGLSNKDKVKTLQENVNG